MPPFFILQLFDTFCDAVYAILPSTKKVNLKPLWFTIGMGAAGSIRGFPLRVGLRSRSIILSTKSFIPTTVIFGVRNLYLPDGLPVFCPVDVSPLYRLLCVSAHQMILPYTAYLGCWRSMSKCVSVPVSFCQVVHRMRYFPLIWVLFCHELLLSRVSSGLSSYDLW